MPPGSRSPVVWRLLWPPAFPETRDSRRVTPRRRAKIASAYGDADRVGCRGDYMINPHLSHLIPTARQDSASIRTLSGNRGHHPAAHGFRRRCLTTCTKLNERRSSQAHVKTTALRPRRLRANASWRSNSAKNSSPLMPSPCGVLPTPGLPRTMVRISSGFGRGQHPECGQEIGKLPRTRQPSAGPRGSQLLPDSSL